MSTILVAGIGQSFRRDDGAGVAAVSLWQKIYPDSSNNPSVRVELVEVSGLAVLDELLDAKAAILVDAVKSNMQPPGFIHLLAEDDLKFFGSGSASAHGLGVAEMLALGKSIYPDRMPETILLIGIEAGDISMGEGLSSQVQTAVQKAAELIEKQVRTLLNREIRE